jgi:hypothetical protein
MTNGGRPRMCVLSMLVLWNATHVIATESSGSTPYQGIVERNVFGLKPPPPPPDPEANKPPPPKIILQGIITFMGNKRALLKVQMPARPPEPAKEVPLVLIEGQRDGDIEVLEINDKPGSEFVKVNDFGTITNLNFENNGIKTAGGPAPGGQPGVSGYVPPPMPGGGVKAIPTTRPMRLPPAGAAALPGGYGGTAMPSSYSPTPAPNTYNAVPTTSNYGSTPAVVTGGGTAGTLALPGLGAAPSTPGRQQNWPPEATSPEEQAIMDAAYTMKNKAAIDQGLMPSVPGSNPLLDSGPPPGQTTTPTTPSLPLPPGAARPFIQPSRPY